jgi:PTH2 family peptidyl-tRNA hydrolase
MKQAIIVNKELKMEKGKICAQVAHASLQAFIMCNKEIREKWLNTGSKKIVLKASLEEMMEIARRADKLNLAVAVIRDAGLTQVKPGSITAVAIGPDEDNVIDALSSKLKLL